MECVSIEVRTGRETLIFLQDMTVQHHILIRLNLTAVLPVVSSVIFLSVGSVTAAGFSSSVQLLSRDFSLRHDGEDGHWRREKKRESTHS